MVADDNRIDVEGVMASEEWITGDGMNDFSARSATCGWAIGAVTSTGGWKEFELSEASEAPTLLPVASSCTDVAGSTPTGLSMFSSSPL